jgi:nucleotide-binding universal stress UspA family protein
LFKKILVPLDGSAHSLKALEEAVQIAKISSGKITLINVCSLLSVLIDPSVSGNDVIPTDAAVSRMMEAVQKCGSQILRVGEQRISAMGVQVEKILVEGHAVQEIARAANEGNFDLIAMGARGVSHMREMVLGSVTDGVLHHAHCAVLVIK